METPKLAPEATKATPAAAVVDDIPLAPAEHSRVNTESASSLQCVCKWTFKIQNASALSAEQLTQVLAKEWDRHLYSVRADFDAWELTQKLGGLLKEFESASEQKVLETGITLWQSLVEWLPRWQRDYPGEQIKPYLKRLVQDCITALASSNLRPSITDTQKLVAFLPGPEIDVTLRQIARTNRLPPIRIRTSDVAAQLAANPSGEEGVPMVSALKAVRAAAEKQKEKEKKRKSTPTDPIDVQKEELREANRLATTIALNADHDSLVAIEECLGMTELLRERLERAYELAPQSTVAEEIDGKIEGLKSECDHYEEIMLGLWDEDEHDAGNGKEATGGNNHGGLEAILSAAAGPDEGGGSRRTASKRKKKEKKFLDDIEPDSRPVTRRKAKKAAAARASPRSAAQQSARYPPPPPPKPAPAAAAAAAAAVAAMPNPQQMYAMARPPMPISNVPQRPPEFHDEEAPLPPSPYFPRGVVFARGASSGIYQHLIGYAALFAVIFKHSSVGVDNPLRTGLEDTLRGWRVDLNNPDELVRQLRMTDAFHGMPPVMRHNGAPFQFLRAKAELDEVVTELIKRLPIALLQSVYDLLSNPSLSPYFAQWDPIVQEYAEYLHMRLWGEVRFLAVPCYNVYRRGEVEFAAQLLQGGIATELGFALYHNQKPWRVISYNCSGDLRNRPHSRQCEACETFSKFLSQFPR